MFNGTLTQSIVSTLILIKIVLIDSKSIFNLVDNNCLIFVIFLNLVWAYPIKIIILNLTHAKKVFAKNMFLI